MSKRRAPRPIASMLPAADYGPALTRSGDGRLRPAWDGASDGIELADVPDIDRSDKRVTVRVARRIDPLIAILDPRRDGPGRQQFVAAEQFRRDSALADGVQGEGERLGVSGVSVGSSEGGPTQTMIDAQSRMQRAWLAVRGPENDPIIADVVRLVVLGWVTLQAVETARRYRHGRARPILSLGLERLADHYGLTGRSRNRLTGREPVK